MSKTRKNSLQRFFHILDNIDRRIIFLFVAISLSLPLIFKVSLPPVEMQTANSFFKEVNNLKKNNSSIILISMDWGPNTLAENKPQTEVAIEHLMRRRIPFALITIYSLASPFLDNIPKDIAEKLEKENPGQKWTYGKDWVNLGYRPGSSIMIQGIAKAENLHQHLKTDAAGTPLADIPCMRNIKTIKNIPMLMEFTGLSGALSAWIQFFQADNFRPAFVHGCTSISIPEAYIYYVSNQLVGLLEGVAGAAWYDTLLTRDNNNREKTSATFINTSLAYAHLLIIALIILGNVAMIIDKRR